MTEVNTKQSEFKIIKDSKDEPTLSSAQKFVGGMVQGIEFPVSYTHLTLPTKA